jgi:hypothetical protein
MTEHDANVAREARLDAVAAARMVIDGADDDAVRAYLAGSAAGVLEAAHACAALAGSLLRLMDPDTRAQILDVLTVAAAQSD